MVKISTIAKDLNYKESEYAEQEAREVIKSKNLKEDHMIH